VEKEVGMRKLFALLILATFIFACGPKMASRETLNMLDECQKAVSSAEAKLSDLETQKKNLEQEKTQLEMKVKELKATVDSLKEAGEK